MAHSSGQIASRRESGQAGGDDLAELLLLRPALDEVGHAPELSLSMAAHEMLGALSGPLVALRAALSPHSGLSDRHRDLLERSVGEIEELSVIVEGLLSCATNGSRPDVAPRIVDLGPVIRQVVHHPMWSSHHDIELDVEPECFVHADPPFVKRALANLLLNAKNHAPPGTPIAVTLRTAGGFAVISVADRGSGIAPESAEAIFEPGVSGGSGHGLGLYIVRRIVEAHGGRVWVDARDGGGSVFRFVLPRAARA